jgi:23S rRNA (cytosine1962-C5)-methyltransferase
MARSRNKSNGKAKLVRKPGYKKARSNKPQNSRLKQPAAVITQVGSGSAPSADHSIAQPDSPIRRRAPKGERVAGSLPVILETAPTSDYALIDSGLGKKLERYGPLRIVRPEAQALWQPRLSEAEWLNVDAIFTGERDEEGMGRWQFPKQQLQETWPLQFDGLDFLGRFTSFRHVGVFPEQAAHWLFMQQAIKSANRPIKLLNLFGYTGVASLVAARAGAHVTHVDASKKAIGWARENQQIAGLDDAPIRWICDDARKFCAREARRGQTYDAILLDPPAYGRGPKGETWQLFDNLPEMLDICRSLISDKPLFVVLTSYAIRASFFAMHEIMQEVFAGCNGELQSGELVLRDEGGDRLLSTSMFSRWIA